MKKRTSRLFLALLLGVGILAACTPSDGGGDGVGTVSSVVITPDGGTVGVGENLALSAQVRGTGTFSTGVTWSSSNESVATVAGGVVTGVSVGTAQITATSRTTPSVSDTVTVTVAAGGGGGGPGSSSLELIVDPALVDAGGSAELSWSIAGDFESAAITAGDAEIVADVSATGTHTVTPDATTTYTLTVVRAGGEPSTATATVTVNESGGPTIGSFDAAMVRGSQMELTWTATGADSFTVYGVNRSGQTVELVADASSGDVVPLPPSAFQRIRLAATNGSGTRYVEHDALPNVVVSTADYDPYDGQDWTPEPAIPGTLRYVIETAVANGPSGETIIGFASDITELTVTGVWIRTPVAGSPRVDSHIYIQDDMIISAPAGGVTIRGESGYVPGDPDDGADGFTYRSRVVYVAPDTDVQLENLTITGGDFIFLGGGIANAGTLLLTDVVVTGNRAWNLGGGIYNSATGDLTIRNSRIEGNTAATFDAEVGTQYTIRGGFAIPDGSTFGAHGYGGGIYNVGTMEVVDSVIEGNDSRFSGGGISNAGAGTLSLAGTNLVDNTADHTVYESGFSYGGGVMNEGTFTFVDGSFTGNHADDQGGGLWQGPDGLSTVTNPTFTDNSADYGGAIRHAYCLVPTLVLVNPTYSGNSGLNGTENISEADDECGDAGDDGIAASSVSDGPVDGRLPSAEAVRDIENLSKDR